MLFQPKSRSGDSACVVQQGKAMRFIASDINAIGVMQNALRSNITFLAISP
jgi:hypothetical protein